MAHWRETAIGLAVVAGVAVMARVTLAADMPTEALPKASAAQASVSAQAAPPVPPGIDWAKELPGNPEGERKVARVTVQELISMLASDKPPVLLDAREHRAFEAGHIPGSIEMGLRVFPFKWRTIPAGSRVVAYCTCPEEHTAARVAYILNMRGYEASALKGGLEAWRAAGREVVTAPAFPGSN